MRRPLVLYDADDVALRVSKPPDRGLCFGYVRHRQDDLRTQLLRTVEAGVRIIYLDVDDDGRFGRGIGGSYRAADSGLTGLEQPVVGPTGELPISQRPAEQLTVEAAEHRTVRTKDLNCTTGLPIVEA